MPCASVLGDGMEQAFAQRVTIVYVQAEDDFHRVRTNYLNAMGRLTEAEGGSAATPTSRPTPT